jgi:uncharacterized membrane protein
MQKTIRRGRVSLSFELTLFLSWVAISIAGAAQAQQPFFIGLALPGQDRSRANAISADGRVVVGTSRLDGPIGTTIWHEVFRWTPETGIVDLNVPPESRVVDYELKGSRSGISIFANRDSPLNALRWTVETGWAPLPIQYISAVSGDGRAAVGDEGSRWTASGGVHRLGIFPGTTNDFVESTGISYDGTVVIGSGFVPIGLNQYQERAFRWTDTDGYSLLGLDTFSGARTAARCKITLLGALTLGNRA